MEDESTNFHEFDPPEPTEFDMAFAVGFFFSLRWILSLFAITVLDADTHTGGGLSLGLNLVLLGLVSLHSLGAGRHTFTSMLRIASVRWVVTFLVFSAVSLLWSSTSSLPASFIYWVDMAADVAMVVILVRAAPATKIASSLFKGYICSTCFIAVIVWIMPLQPDLRLGNKDFFNTNQIAQLCAFAIFLAQYLMRQRKGKWNLAVALLGVTLLRSLSKATLVAFLLSQGFLLIMDRSLSRKTKITLSAAVVGVVLIFWGLIESYYVVYTNAGNQAETLTGRLGIWAYLLDSGLEKPWIGHGFNSIWKVVPPFGDFEARHAENDILQQFYAYGIAGIVLLAGLYGSIYLRLRRLSKRPLKLLFISLLIFILVRGLAEAEPFDPLLPLWAIALFGVLLDEIGSSDKPLISAPGSNLLESRAVSSMT